MYATRDTIDTLCDTSSRLSVYQLKRDDSLLLYRLAQGQTLADIAEELDKKESTLYERCRLIQKKFAARTFKQVMFTFGQCLVE